MAVYAFTRAAINPAASKGYFPPEEKLRGKKKRWRRTALDRLPPWAPLFSRRSRTRAKSSSRLKPLSSGFRKEETYKEKESF